MQPTEKMREGRGGRLRNMQETGGLNDSRGRISLSPSGNDSPTPTCMNVEVKKENNNKIQESPISVLGINYR